MKSEIIIPKWAWITGVFVILLGLGLVISPWDRDGRPMLLLPDVKAVEDYRRSLVSWHDRLQELDGRIARVLSNNYGGDLFSQSSEGQKIMGETVQLLQEIDQTETPSAAVPARDMIMLAGSASLDASKFMLTWISAPTPANLNAAQQALAGARTTLSNLEASAWMGTNQ